MMYLALESSTCISAASPNKCEEFFAQRNASRTTLVSSHNLPFVERFCERTLWLDGGRQMALGPTADVLEQYCRFSPN